METDGGGWTVFQRRRDGSVDFNRGWDDYVAGFGDLEGEFWMGLEKLYRIAFTSIPFLSRTLRIELKDFDNEERYAKYSRFSIDATSSHYYRLHVGSYYGNAGDSLEYHGGQRFTTKDKDHDMYNYGNCAEKYGGGWWFHNCYHSNLNGQYLRGSQI